MKRLECVALFALLVSVPALLAAQALNTSLIDQALGRSGTRAGDVYKVAFPRTDLHVTVLGLAIRPGLALGSWAAFIGSENHAIVVGDLCLLPEEVNPVMARLRAGDIEVMALHNHLLFENPRVMFLHFMGQGNSAALAESLRAALLLSKTPLGKPAPSPAPATAPEWVKTVESALGHNGSWNGGVLSVSVPRATAVRDDGWTIPPAMGVAESMNFQAAGGGRVAATGDFVLTAQEVNPVVSALETHHILVTAVHSHMLTEQPRLFFVHFWVLASPQDSAAGLRAALAHVNTR